MEDETTFLNFLGFTVQGNPGSHIEMPIYEKENLVGRRVLEQGTSSEINYHTSIPHSERFQYENRGIYAIGAFPLAFFLNPSLAFYVVTKEDSRFYIQEKNHFSEFTAELEQIKTGTTLTVVSSETGFQLSYRQKQAKTIVEQCLQYQISEHHQQVLYREKKDPNRSNSVFYQVKVEGPLSSGPSLIQVEEYYQNNRWWGPKGPKTHFVSGSFVEVTEQVELIGDFYRLFQEQFCHLLPTEQDFLETFVISKWKNWQISREKLQKRNKG